MTSRGSHRRERDQGEAWTGGHRPYDIVKEGAIALAVVTALTILLAILFGSPDEAPVTMRSWSRAAPADFVAASVSELNGTSEIAQYGPPYTNTPDASQKVGPVCLQCLPGVRIRVSAPDDFILAPLRGEATADPVLEAAIRQYISAPAGQQAAWTDAYTKALDKATFEDGRITIGPGDYGPVQTMMQSLLGMAQSGGLDGALVSTKQFYQTDYTKPILYISGGSYFEDQAAARHLLGEQWGMMNETGDWPGQPWLWLYTFWYQVPPFSTSGNADAEVWVIMLALTLILLFAPFIPGIRSIPKWSRVYRLIWRDHYRTMEHGG